MKHQNMLWIHVSNDQQYKSTLFQAKIHSNLRVLMRNCEIMCLFTAQIEDCKMVVGKVKDTWPGGVHYEFADADADADYSMECH
jgi:hypothetical protein